MNGFYLTLQGGDTTMILAERLDIENYGVGLVEIMGQLKPHESKYKDTKSYFLCSDISQNVYVNQIKLPVLRRITFDDTWHINMRYEKIIWLRIEREPISKINLYITDEKGSRVSFSGKGLMCTLLLIPRKSKRTKFEVNC